MMRHRILFESLIRSGIAKDGFPTAKERAEQSTVAGPMKQFLIVVLPDGTTVTPSIADQV
jgi:hypothetical protein